MPDKQKSFAETLLKNTARADPEDQKKTYTSEHTAQAQNLQVEYKTGRLVDVFTWPMFRRARWTDEGEHERLTIVFADGLIEIEGHNLRVLLDQINEGKLKGVKEQISSQVTLMQANAAEEPVIRAVRSYPDFEEVLQEVKGDGDRSTGFAGKVHG
jgi:hypothetical protein